MAQLVLNFDASSADHRYSSSGLHGDYGGNKKMFSMREPFSLALAAVARQFFEAGRDRQANKVVALAR